MSLFIERRLGWLVSAVMSLFIEERLGWLVSAVTWHVKIAACIVAKYEYYNTFIDNDFYDYAQTSSYYFGSPIVGEWE